MPENNAGKYPVSLETVKNYLRVDFPDDDVYDGHGKGLYPRRHRRF